MQTLVLSDTHFTARFNRQQCDYIVKLLDSVDQVVLNGDIWDSYLSTLAAFLEAWQPLLTKLATKKTYYLPGNHDPAELLDARVEAFAKVVSGELVLRIGTKTYRFQHGHELAQEFDGRHPLLTHLFSHAYPFFVSLTKKPVIGQLLQRRQQGVNQNNHHQLLAYAAAHAAQDELYVFAHSHIPADLPDQHYLNPGPTDASCVRYIVLSESGYEVRQHELQH